MSVYYVLQFFFLLVPSLIGVIYGVLTIKREEMTLFRMMTLLGLACLALGQLSYIIANFTFTLDNYFNIGSLGGLGMSLFMLVANMNVSLREDEITRPLGRCKLLALAAPILMFAIFFAASVYWYYLLGELGVLNNSLFLVVTVMSSVTAYHALLRVLAPTEKGGENDSHRAFNIALTIFMILSTINRAILLAPLFLEINVPLFVAFYLVMGVNILAIVPLMKRGVVK